MKFDFIIGNPPYQEERKGESNTALPIYNNFMKNVYPIADVVELITPARFLFNAGRTPKPWNEQMLNDEHLKVLHYEKDASSIFPNTEIKGGVAVTYHDVNRTFEPIGTFTMYDEMNDILSKVKARLKEGAISDIAFVASKFDIKTLLKDYPELEGRERRMSSNVLSLPVFSDDKGNEKIMIYGIFNHSRKGRYIERRYVDLSDEKIGKYKVVLPKADGNGHFGDSLTNPEILKVNTGFTHSFLGLGGYSTLYEAESLLKYVKTKFSRSLLSVLKITQDVNADKWRYVPLQDFTPSSDIDWSKSVKEIDQQLYKKYGLSEEEVAFIESHVKEMA